MLDPATLALIVVTALLAGVLAGLLGIGGGVVIVPALLVVFARAGVDGGVAVQLAVGTSLATIVLTSISSAWSHHRRGALRLHLALWFAPGLVVGAVAGALLAIWMSGRTLQLLFGVFLVATALRMALVAAPSASAPRQMSVAARLAGGLVIGLVSAMVGIGGGVMSVPLFVLAAGLTIHQAVGTAPALGLVLSVVGTATYVVRGLGEPALPPGTLGYVALLPAVVIATGTVTVAPLGASLAHRLPRRTLSTVFALLLLVVAGKLIWGAASGA